MQAQVRDLQEGQREMELNHRTLLSDNQSLSAKLEDLVSKVTRTRSFEGEMSERIGAMKEEADRSFTCVSGLRGSLWGSSPSILEWNMFSGIKGCSKRSLRVFAHKKKAQRRGPGKWDQLAKKGGAFIYIVHMNRRQFPWLQKTQAINCPSTSV